MTFTNHLNISLCLFLFFLTDQKSFNEVDGWIEDIKTERGNNVVIALVGNKVDLEVNTTYIHIANLSFIN